MTQPIILASKSSARRALLAAAGVPHEATSAGVDEDEIKTRLVGAPIADIAMALAEAKAIAVSRRRPEAFVIGADQILELEGRGFDKPKDMAEAKARIILLSGKTHRLRTAAAIARDARIVWRHEGAPALAARELSEAEIDRYLADVGDSVLQSVGAYQLEGAGARLFSDIDGAHADILGLPTVPLFSFLRAHADLPY